MLSSIGLPELPDVVPIERGGGGGGEGGREGGKSHHKTELMQVGEGVGAKI